MKNILQILLIPVFLFPQSGNDIIIRTIQDKRVEQTSELFSFLKSENARERELALLAFANIQDTTALDEAAQLLNDDMPKVRSMAAFALGMIGHPKGTSFLFRRLAVEREDECVAEYFNAIGLCGTPDDLKKIVVQAEDYPTEWRPYVAQAIIRFINRKVKDIAASKFIATLLYENNSVINATYALMRINDTTVTNNHKEKLHRQLTNTSTSVRMWSATALGALNDNVTIDRLRTSAKKDKDWRVRVNAIRALRTKSNAKSEIESLIADKNEHVALTAMATFDGMFPSEAPFSDSAKWIARLQSKNYAVSVREELRKFIAKRLGERAIPLIGNWKGELPFVSAQRVRSYGETRSEKAIPMIKEAIFQSNQSLVIIAGIESYQIIAQRSNEQVKKDFLKTAILMFGKNDPGISYSAAVAFQDTSFSKAIRKIYLSALITSYNRMKQEIDLEPMVELLNVFSEIGDSSVLPVVQKGLTEQNNVIRTAAEKAYQSITGEDSPIQFIKHPNSYKPLYSPGDISLLAKYKGAEVTTSKGTIRITFDKEAAPFTVLNFILLSQKKFYDGLSFHRVVSNFVIQGGDPLGNGSGGPNYSIRTEVHPHAKYKTGAVGMASSGKDTEGSQWFITHCPTPHLDFRYTIFGYTSDSKIIDQMMVGDTIVKVVLF